MTAATSARPQSCATRATAVAAHVTHLRGGRTPPPTANSHPRARHAPARGSGRARTGTPATSPALPCPPPPTWHPHPSHQQRQRRVAGTPDQVAAVKGKHRVPAPPQEPPTASSSPSHRITYCEATIDNPARVSPAQAWIPMKDLSAGARAASDLRGRRRQLTARTIDVRAPGVTHGCRHAQGSQSPNELTLDARV